MRRVAVALLLTASVARAQEVGAAPLTLTQALVRAAERNPSLAAQGYQERAADALIEQAGLRPNPRLEIEAENFIGTGVLQGVRSLETTVQASQAFERGGKRQKRVTLATRGRESVAKELALRRAEVLAGTARAFIDALAAQHRLALAAEPLQLAREIVAATDARVQAGAASPAESARGRVALASAQAEVARARADMNTARVRLAAKWGGQSADFTAVAGFLQVPDELPNGDAFLTKIATHPRLALQQALIAGRRAALELEQAEAAHDVTVGGGLRFLREGSDAGFVAGVSIPLPVRNQNQGNIRAARETLAGAEHALHAIEAELRAAFTGAWQELSAAHATVQSLRREVLPATQEAHAIVRRAYEEGHLPLMDVLDAQRALISLRRELLDAEVSYAATHAHVEALADSSFPMTAILLSTK
jgi:outer membrane protein, heavy metal efflux system